ncbi:xanthine dehydrogenase family protein subunit M [Variovorax sp. OK605]|uniref:FAD binding domain-containing protein n=1 Tax=Variovorax sp. OK605 TaxID=1855317 RepID=UPI00210B9FBC|nr:FAD binding domain-containing protein [Variovorax sp. OK605]
MTGVWRSKSMFRLFDLIAAMVRHHPVHSAAIADRPKRLVDVTRLPLREIQRTRSGLSIGALATNTKTANHPLVRENYPPFAMVSVAAALDMDGSEIRQARVVLGVVAHKPWRSAEAEAILVGQRADEATFKRAAEAALRDARPLAHNAHKVELARRSVVRALMRASRLA